VGSLELRERQWIRELVYGTLRFRGRLDHLLSARLRDGLNSVPADVLMLLRIGAYQLLYMESVPPYAAVSQSVEATKTRYGKGLGGLVNAVLRGIERDGAPEDAFPDPRTRPVEFLTAWGSHPSWMIERWLRRWSFEEVRALVEANNRIPGLTVRAYAGDTGLAVRALEEAGLAVAPAGFGSACLEVSGASPGEVLDAAPLIVQDPAAAAVSDAVGSVMGRRIADLCAAPGGKALVLAGAGGSVLAVDLSGRRLALVHENVRRLEKQLEERPRVGMVLADARHPPVTDAGVVLVDVPCTGTGTLRRNPDARWRLTPHRLGTLVELQTEILDAAAGAVGPEGLLVYSTCSLEPEENQGRVEHFLTEHPEFRLEVVGGMDDRLVDGEGMLDVHPQITGFDGAFAARLRRT